MTTAEVQTFFAALIQFLSAAAPLVIIVMQIFANRKANVIHTLVNSQAEKLNQITATDAFKQGQFAEIANPTKAAAANAANTHGKVPAT